MQKQEKTMRQKLSNRAAVDGGEFDVGHVVRANMSFFPSAKKPEMGSDTDNPESVPHPLHLFEYLQDENPWVDLAVRVTASACSSTNPLFILSTTNKKKKAKVEEYRKKLMKPNPFMTGKDLLLRTYSDLYALGNCYWHVIKNKAGGLHSIYPLQAKHMRVSFTFDQDNNVVIKYKNVHKNIDLTEKEIVHFKLPNPKSILYGRPIFYANILSIITDEEVNKWVQAYFAQSFSGGAIFTQEADELVAERNRQWLAEEYTKPENAGKPMLLEGNFQMISDGSKFKDFDYSELKKVSREEIMQHAGVPLSQAGVRSDSGQANIEVIASEQESFIRNTVSNIHDIVFEKLNQDFFGTIFEEADIIAAPGLLNRFSNQNAIRFADSAAKFGITLNEYRKMMGLPEVDDEKGGNTWLTATNNGVIPTKFIIGVDPETGEESPTILDATLLAGQVTETPAGDKSGDKKPKAKKAKGNGFTNLASVADNPSGRGDV